MLVLVKFLPDSPLLGLLPIVRSDRTICLEAVLDVVRQRQIRDERLFRLQELDARLEHEQRQFGPPGRRVFGRPTVPESAVYQGQQRES